MGGASVPISHSIIANLSLVDVGPTLSTSFVSAACQPVMTLSSRANGSKARPNTRVEPILVVLRAIENFLDMGHLTFGHGGYLGDESTSAVASRSTRRIGGPRRQILDCVSQLANGSRRALRRIACGARPAHRRAMTTSRE